MKRTEALELKVGDLVVVRNRITKPTKIIEVRRWNEEWKAYERKFNDMGATEEDYPHIIVEGGQSFCWAYVELVTPARKYQTELAVADNEDGTWSAHIVYTPFDNKEDATAFIDKVADRMADWPETSLRRVMGGAGDADTTH